MNEVKTAYAVAESIADDWRAILAYEYQADRFEDEDLRNLSRVLDELPALYDRANATEAAEAQLVEAVELLRRVANPNQYGDPTPREFAGLRNDARAFLAKVDAP